MNQFIQKILCNNERKKFKKQAGMQPVVRKEYPYVCVISDVPYTYSDCESDPGDTYDPDFKMDMYHIDKREEKSPVIISVHGGGLMNGSKEFNRSMCMELANHGFLVFAIEYPKLPEYTIDEILETIVYATNLIWFVSELKGGDPENIFLIGDSAGAFLATYATAIIHNHDLAEQLDMQICDAAIRIKALALISGLFYTTGNDRIRKFYQSMLYGRNMKNEALRKYTNPENKAIIGNLPPCILFTSAGDFLKSQSQAFEKALEDNGVSCWLEYYDDPGLVHDFPLFQCDRPETEDVIGKIMDFFWGCVEE